MLNTQLQTADMRWSSNLTEAGQGANNATMQNPSTLRGGRQGFAYSNSEFQLDSAVFLWYSFSLPLTLSVPD
jgi:hypothetical protein